MNFKKMLLLAILIAAIGATSCRTAPVAERDSARLNIEKAKLVDAEKHAAEDFSQAESQYQLGEENFVADKKVNANKTAAEAFVVAEQKAKDAYQKSVEPYTKEKITTLEEDLDFAVEEEQLDRKSPDHFLEAEDNLLKALAELGDERYDAAATSVQESIKKVEAAYANAERLEEELENLQAELEELLASALEQKAENATPELYQQATDAQQENEETIQEGFYQDGVGLQEDLLATVEEMLSIIEEKRRLSQEELTIADGKINQAEQSVKNSETEE